MNNRKILLTIVLGTAGVFAAAPRAAAAAARGLDLPPHIYAGTVRGHDAGNLATEPGRAEVRARKADGTLLARSAVRLVPGERCNYALAIPMNLSPSPLHAAPGERLTFEVADSEGNFYRADAAFPPVGRPGRVSRVDLIASPDEDGNGIADAYESDIADYMEVMGIPGPFDAAADYDADGMSNRAEYLAGTDPFSDADSLRILSFDCLPGGLCEASFLPAPNRAYGVLVSTNLAAGAASFRPAAHLAAADTNAPPQAIVQTGPEPAAVRPLYLIPEKDHAFFRLRLE